jgi:hypothetical protein
MNWDFVAERIDPQLVESAEGDRGYPNLEDIQRREAEFNFRIQMLLRRGLCPPCQRWSKQQAPTEAAPETAEIQQ